MSVQADAEIAVLPVFITLLNSVAANPLNIGPALLVAEAQLPQVGMQVGQEEVTAIAQRLSAKLASLVAAKAAAAAPPAPAKA